MRYKMKVIVLKQEAYFIGKIDDIIKYLTELQGQYTTINEYINDKQSQLKN